MVRLSADGRFSALGLGTDLHVNAIMNNLELTLVTHFASHYFIDLDLTIACFGAFLPAGHITPLIEIWALRLSQ